MNTPRGAAASVDFTELTGVGAKISTALGDAGINSMRFLAEMSVDDVVHALDQVGVQVSATKIISQRWLQQAWAASEGKDGIPSGADEIPIETKARTAEANDWQEHAGFFIYFDRSGDGSRWRTRVWDTGVMIEQQIPGTAPDRWVNFILNRANLPTGAESGDLDRPGSG